MAGVPIGQGIPTHGTSFTQTRAMQGTLDAAAGTIGADVEFAARC